MARVDFTIRVDIPIQVGDVVRVNGELMRIINITQGEDGLDVVAATLYEHPIQYDLPILELRDIAARADALLAEIVAKMDGRGEETSS